MALPNLKMTQIGHLDFSGCNLSKITNCRIFVLLLTINFISVVFAVNVCNFKLSYYFPVCPFTACKFVCLIFDIFYCLSNLSITSILWTVCPCYIKKNLGLLVCRTSFLFCWTVSGRIVWLGGISIQMDAITGDRFAHATYIRW